ncbi:unnamed protein product [Urochloa decumbens]|uniref:DUF1618 domain-containing protein n=1 Tax=Urochloa decumbens TaxID=240449 RepID=A0ABC8ZDQ1_9POAL
MRDSHLRRGSLHPPSHGAADLAESSRPDWVLLDFRAYFADCRNSTTASCKTRNGKDKIQVTFFPARPPRLSYFCVHCQGVEPSGFAMEPKVLATHDNVLLLRISIGSPNQIICHYLHEYYVYRASNGADARPSLELLPHPGPCFFFDEQVGILSRGTGYTVVALRDDGSGFDRGSYTPGEYDVCLLDSENKNWTKKDVFVPLHRQQQASNGEERFSHESSKVITIGGEHGTVAFVDLSRGILLFNVLQGDPMLRYFMMPPLLNRSPGRRSNCDQDIALVNGCFKVVDFLSKISRVEGSYGDYMNDGWAVATWEKEVESPEVDSWSPCYNLASHNIDTDHNPLLVELLPKLPGYEGQLIFQRLHTGHPTVSLCNDHVVYLMTKVELSDSKAWVIAIDMSNGMLQDVAEFSAGRTFDTSSAFTQSTISKHLIMTSGTKGEEKRHGSPLQGPHLKKLLSDEGYELGEVGL